MLGRRGWFKAHATGVKAAPSAPLWSSLHVGQVIALAGVRSLSGRYVCIGSLGCSDWQGRRTDRRSWPPFQRAWPLDVGFRSARNPPGSGLRCRRASVMKESELVSDSGRDAVLVFGGQEV
jgi:hypothetical protein